VTFEVEFVSGEGTTLAVLTLPQHDIRPMHAREILHVRALAGPRVPLRSPNLRRTRVCRRLPPAYAPASLRLPAAPET
jgi:hypothetical protein